jgi:hypothetical protein
MLNQTIERRRRKERREAPVEATAIPMFGFWHRLSSIGRSPQ